MAGVLRALMSPKAKVFGQPDVFKLKDWDAVMPHPDPDQENRIRCSQQQGKLPSPQAYTDVVGIRLQDHLAADRGPSRL